MKTRKIIANNYYIIRYLFKLEPWLVLGTAINSILINNISVICNVILLPFLINSVFKEVYYPVARERLSCEIQRVVNKKAINIDIAYYDNPDFYNELVWNMSYLENKVDLVFGYIDSFPGYLVGFLMTVAAFIYIDKKLFIFVLLSVLITFAFNKSIANGNYEKECALLEVQRRKGYVEKIFRKRQYAGELRLSRIGALLLSNYNEAREEYDGLLVKKTARLWKLNFFQLYLSGYFMVNFVIVIYLGYNILVSNHIKGGNFIAIFNGVNSLLSTLYYLLGPFITRFTEGALFTDKFRAFLELKNKVTTGIRYVKDEPHSIEFKNVSFSYDGKKNVINRMSCILHSDKSYLIVGENGTGKSTFVKLLTRLYDVSDGEILLDGINIKEYSLESYRSLFGVFFQNYQLYATTIGKNVAASNEYSLSRVETVLDKCDMGKLGLDMTANVMKEFSSEGILLSGGERQKLGIARAIYNDSKILIFDEPSASLDAIAEQKVNKVILEAGKGKMAIQISHRLSAALNSDLIIVLDEGAIRECGKHKDLIESRGLYYKMWQCQASKY